MTTSAIAPRRACAALAHAAWRDSGPRALRFDLASPPRYTITPRLHGSGRPQPPTVNSTLPASADNTDLRFTGRNAAQESSHPRRWPSSFIALGTGAVSTIVSVANAIVPAFLLPAGEQRIGARGFRRAHRGPPAGRCRHRIRIYKHNRGGPPTPGRWNLAAWFRWFSSRMSTGGEGGVAALGNYRPSGQLLRRARGAIRQSVAFYR
jgi:hypothetical protein